jgi:hypothetical protein
MPPKRRRTPSMRVTAPSRRVLPPTVPVVAPAALVPLSDRDHDSTKQPPSIIGSAFARAGRTTTPPPAEAAGGAFNAQPQHPPQHRDAADQHDATPPHRPPLAYKSPDAASTTSSTFSPQGFEGPSFSSFSAHSPSKSSFSDYNNKGTRWGTLTGGESPVGADEPTTVELNDAGVAEMFVNVRVTRRRSVLPAVEALLRAKPLWKHRLLRITAVAPADTSASHRAMLEIFRLKHPETGSRATAGLIQRVYLRSLDNLRRASVAQRDSLPFYVTVEAPLGSSAPGSPTTNGRGGVPAPSAPAGRVGSSFSGRPRTGSTSSTGGKPQKLAREFRFGQLLLRLGFVRSENRDLHDLRSEEESLRRVARREGLEGLKAAASPSPGRDRSVSPSSVFKRVVEKARAALSSSPSKQPASPSRAAATPVSLSSPMKSPGASPKSPSPSRRTSMHANGPPAMDPLSLDHDKDVEKQNEDDEDVESIDLCFPNTLLRDAWYEWFNQFILEHELNELREDTDAHLSRAEVARQKSITQLLHRTASLQFSGADASSADPSSALFAPPSPSRRLTMFSAGSDATNASDFGQTVASLDLGSTEHSPSDEAVSALLFASRGHIPERPGDESVRKFVEHFQSVDPTTKDRERERREAELAARVQSEGEQRGLRKTPNGGKVMKVEAGGGMVKRRLACQIPGELQVKTYSGPLPIRTEIVNIDLARVTVETPWTRNFLIVTNVDDRMLASRGWGLLDLISALRKKQALELDINNAGGATAEGALNQADQSISIAGDVDTGSSQLLEFSMPKSEDREAMVEWLISIKQVSQSTRDTYVYQAVEAVNQVVEDRSDRGAVVGDNNKDSPFASFARDGGASAGGTESPHLGVQRTVSMKSSGSGGQNSSSGAGGSSTATGQPKEAVVGPIFGTSPRRGTAGPALTDSAVAGLPLTSTTSKPRLARSTSLQAANLPSQAQRRSSLTDSRESSSGGNATRAWMVEGAYGRSFLSPNYHGRSRVPGGGRRTTSSSQDGTSSDESDDELPEFMIARPLQSGQSSGTATPPVFAAGGAKQQRQRSLSLTALTHASRGLESLSAAGATGAGADEAAGVYALDECGYWCYVAYHAEGLPPTTASNFALRFVYLSAADPPTRDEASHVFVPPPRPQSGRFVVLNTNNVAGTPCIDATGADITQVDMWSPIAGPAGVVVKLRAGKHRTVVTHIVPWTRTEHRFVGLFLRHRFTVPMSEVQADGTYRPAAPKFIETQHQQQQQQPSGHREKVVRTVLSGIDAIMARGKDQATAQYSPLETSPDISASAAQVDPQEALKRHFLAEALREIEMASAESDPLPCPLCGTANRALVNVCPATGMFHKEAVEARMQDRQRGFVSSVFDELPPRSVEVMRPPVLPLNPSRWTEQDAHAAMAYNASLDNVIAECRAAMRRAEAAHERAASALAPGHRLSGLRSLLY